MKLILWMVAFVLVAGSGWVIYDHKAARQGFGDVTNRDGSPLQPERTDPGATDPDARPATTTDRSDRQPDMVAAVGAASQPSEAAKAAAGAPPATDTMAPSSPNGLAFAGVGKFQWYRQGNLTWRLNTESGSTCIAFATLDEWKKPLVVRHGCGAAA